MALSQTQRKALQQACGTCPTEIIATSIEYMFPVKLVAQRWTPLMYAVSELYTEH